MFEHYPNGNFSSRTKSTCSSRYTSGGCLRWESEWEDHFSNGKRHSRTIYGERNRDTKISYCEDGIKIKSKTVIYGDDYFRDRSTNRYGCPEDNSVTVE